MTGGEAMVAKYVHEAEPRWPEDLRAPDGAPDVIVIVLDDVGFAQLGCYGSDIATPHIDALAAEGLQHTNFHTTALCSASRASLLIGRNHRRNGMGRVIELATAFPGYNARIPRSNGFLSEALLAAGYATMAVGKWHLTPEEECHAGRPGGAGRWDAASSASTAS
jgi:arylsulfatase A-like enzyme